MGPQMSCVLVQGLVRVCGSEAQYRTAASPLLSMHWIGRSPVLGLRCTYTLWVQPFMSLIMYVWLSIWLSFWIVSLCGDLPGCGLVRWRVAFPGHASTHRPDLYPFDPLYVRVSSSFIVFSDPCTYVCTRFNKGFELWTCVSGPADTKLTSS